MTTKKRPKVLPGVTIKYPLGCGNFYVTLNRLPETGEVFEVFGYLGKSGGCTKAISEALTRVISIGIRSGCPVEELVGQLENIVCPNHIIEDGVQISSCADAIAKALREYGQPMSGAVKEVPSVTKSTDSTRRPGSKA